MKKYILFFVVVMVAISSCDNDSIKADGDILTQTYDLQSFTSVRIAIPAEVHIVQNNEQMVEIETHENLFNNIRARVSGGELFIDSKDNIRNLRTLNIYIQVADLDLIKFAGAGNIIVDGCINTDELTVETAGAGNIDLCGVIGDLKLKITGSGNINATSLTVDNLNVNSVGSGNFDLEGTTDYAKYKITGSGRIRAFDLTANDLDVNIVGSGLIESRVENKLDVRISGSGDIRYKGEPTVTTNITGSGRVIAVD